MRSTGGWRRPPSSNLIPIIQGRLLGVDTNHARSESLFCLAFILLSLRGDFSRKRSTGHARLLYGIRRILRVEPEL
jgi:hypothetical protein